MPLLQFILLCLALGILAYIVYRLTSIEEEMPVIVEPEPLIERRHGDRRSGRDRREGTRAGASAGRRSHPERRYATKRLRALNRLAL